MNEELEKPAALESVEVIIEENAPRDGIQNETVPFSLDERVRLIDALSGCGFSRIQVGSFVNPHRVPQMAHTEQLFLNIQKLPGVQYSALILNERGLQRALDCGMEHLSIFASASEAHSKRNSNCSVQEGLRQAVRLVKEACSRGVHVRAGVMNAFGCRLEGAVPEARVVEMVLELTDAGAEEINLADTSGVADPGQLKGLVGRVGHLCPVPLALHLHDTYGFGMANVYAAWESGVRRFDASCGGLGGCPFIPNAAGNVPTEDVVHLFSALGVSTGISLDGAAGIVASLERKLGRNLPGRYAHIARSHGCAPEEVGEAPHSTRRRL